VSQGFENVRRAGDLIRERIGNRKQREVAEEMGINTSDLNRILTGSVAKPSFHLLCQIGNYLNISPNELADWYGYRLMTKEEKLSEEVNNILVKISQLKEEDQSRIFKTIEVLIDQALI
jgi:transcriptional regulator with XRE-family HTH domain